MYTKPIIFKIYSIIMLVASLAGAAYTFIGYSGYSSLLSGVVGDAAIFPVIAIVIAIISLFIAYMEFSSMFTFAQMIEHEQRNDLGRFKRMGGVFSPQFYKKYGTIMFYLLIVFQVIGIIAAAVLCAVAKLAFWPFFWIIVGSLVLCAVSVVLYYVQFYCKYRTFGDLLAVKSNQTVMDDTLQSLSKSNPNHLRGFCTFLYVLGLIYIGVSLVSIIFVGVTGVFITISAIITFIHFGIIGCYFDNLAKMQEHYLIKYKKI